jgi:hypothetical protein
MIGGFDAPTQCCATCFRHLPPDTARALLGVEL